MNEPIAKKKHSDRHMQQAHQANPKRTQTQQQHTICCLAYSRAETHFRRDIQAANVNSDEKSLIEVLLASLTL